MGWDDRQSKERNTSLTDELVGWDHQTYAEFLAARFLHDRSLSVDDTLRLLVSPTSGRIVPALRETASWLAGMDQGVFRRLIEVDAETLLRSDFALVRASEQAALVESLLRNIENEGAWAMGMLYGREVQASLAHPGLAEQLRWYIFDRARPPMARRVAIDLAKGCGLKALQELLINVALDESERNDVRASAAEALANVGSPTGKLRLKPLASVSTDDELKGCALRALWPDCLTADELFACLQPAAGEISGGSYGSFLSKLDDELGPEHLPSALVWTCTLPARHGLSYYPTLFTPRFE